MVIFCLSNVLNSFLSVENEGIINIKTRMKTFGPFFNLFMRSFSTKVTKPDNNDRVYILEQ